MVENSMITVCYTADSGYAMQVAVSMVSMLDHNKNTKDTILYSWGQL